MNTSSFSSIHVATLNNEGADLLNNGDLEGGMKYFKNALIASKNLLQDQLFELANSSTSSSPLQHVRLDQFISFEAMVAVCDSEATTTTTDKKNDVMINPDFIRRAFKFRLQNPELLHTIKQSGQILAMLIVFNLAIATHLLAESSCKNSSSIATSTNKNNQSFFLQQQRQQEQQQQENDASSLLPKMNITSEMQRAIQLYEYSFTLLQKFNMTSSIFLSNEEVFLFAILNNLSHAHVAVGNKLQAERCSQHLLSALMVFHIDTISRQTSRNHNEETTRNRILHGAIFEVFLRSTNHLIFGATNPNPASAA